MRTPNILGICAALSTGLFAQQAAPPAERPMPSLQTRGQMQRRAYDKSREETIKAKVVDVREIDRGPMVVVVLAVQVDGQDAEIPLASKDYLKENGMAFSKGDEITIKGGKDSRHMRMTPGGAEGLRPKDAALGGSKATAAPAKPDPEIITLRKVTPPESAKPGKEGPAAQKDAKTAEGAALRRPGDAPRIRAREVTKGNKTLTLLHDDGRPAWRPAPQADGQPMPESLGKPGKPEHRGR
jgi:hypothetical protein